jgi:hypothetical protein
LVGPLAICHSICLRTSAKPRSICNVDDRAARNSGGVTALTEEMIGTCDGEKRSVFAPGGSADEGLV